MTRVALLDVNVLVALFDPDHVHHDAAHAWFSQNRKEGWATCPLTENALVRILSNAAYSGTRQTAAAIRDRLEAFCSSGHQAFWTAGLSLRDKARFKLSGLTHRQVTDVYLLALAIEKSGRLATFDRRIPARAAIGATQERLEVIPA